MSDTSSPLQSPTSTSVDDDMVAQDNNRPDSAASHHSQKRNDLASPLPNMNVSVSTVFCFFCKMTFTQYTHFRLQQRHPQHEPSPSANRILELDYKLNVDVNIPPPTGLCFTIFFLSRDYFLPHFLFSRIINCLNIYIYFFDNKVNVPVSETVT